MLRHMMKLGCFHFGPINQITRLLCSCTPGHLEHNSCRRNSFELYQKLNGSRMRFGILQLLSWPGSDWPCPALITPLLSIKVSCLLVIIAGASVELKTIRLFGCWKDCWNCFPSKMPVHTEFSAHNGLRVKSWWRLSLPGPFISL